MRLTQEPGYRDLRDFFVEFGIQIHFDKYERIFLNRWFLDMRSKKRDEAPNFNDAMLENWANRICELRQTKLTPGRMFKALVRSKDNGLKELKERYLMYVADREVGINSDRSLAISKIDISLVRLLRDRAYMTSTAIHRAQDKELLEIKGINKRSLEQIRRFYKHQAEKTLQPALQLTLFSVSTRPV